MAIFAVQNNNHKWKKLIKKVKGSDVTSKKRLIKENLQYKNRYLYGDNWRADNMRAIQLEFKNRYHINKAIGCCYPSAHRLFNDHKLVQSA